MQEQNVALQLIHIWRKFYSVFSSFKPMSVKQACLPATARHPPERLELKASVLPRALMSSAQSCISRWALMFPVQGGRDAFCASLKKTYKCCLSACKCSMHTATYGLQTCIRLSGDIWGLHLQARLLAFCWFYSCCGSVTEHMQPSPSLSPTVRSHSFIVVLEMFIKSNGISILLHKCCHSML